MDQQHPVSTSSPRRPASNSFEDKDVNFQRITKILRNGNQLHCTKQIQQHHNTLVPSQTRHPFNINVLKRAVTHNLLRFFHHL